MGCVQEVNLGIKGANYGWGEREGTWVIKEDNENVLFPAAEVLAEPPKIAGAGVEPVVGAAVVFVPKENLFDDAAAWSSFASFSRSRRADISAGVSFFGGAETCPKPVDAAGLAGSVFAAPKEKPVDVGSVFAPKEKLGAFGSSSKSGAFFLLARASFLQLWL